MRRYGSCREDASAVGKRVDGGSDRRCLLPFGGKGGVGLPACLGQLRTSFHVLAPFGIPDESIRSQALVLALDRVTFVHVRSSLRYRRCGTPDLQRRGCVRGWRTFSVVGDAVGADPFVHLLCRYGCRHEDTRSPRTQKERREPRHVLPERHPHGRGSSCTQSLMASTDTSKCTSSAMLGMLFFMPKSERMSVPEAMPPQMCFLL